MNDTVHGRSADLPDRLDAELAARRDELAALTAELIRFPTVNPPGDGYREICDFIADRLRRRDFGIEIVRAIGALGDSDAHPRWNLVARRQGTRPGDCVHFNSHTDVVEPGRGWTLDPFAGAIRDGRGVRARRVRHEGRARHQRRRRRGLHRPVPGLRRGDRDLGHLRRGVRWLRRCRVARRARLLRSRARAARDHPRAAEPGPDLSRSPRRAVDRGRDARAHRARLDAVSRRLRGAPHGRGAARDRDGAAARARGARHGDAGGAGIRPARDAERELGARGARGSRRPATRACRRRSCPTAAGSCWTGASRSRRRSRGFAPS